MGKTYFLPNSLEDKNQKISDARIGIFWKKDPET